MRIAVTGANGLIGGEAVALLEGHEVLALGKGPCRLAPGAYTYAAADLGERGSTASALLDFRAEAVLHAGALTDVDGCERDPDLAWRVNVEGTAEVARACRSLGARLVALSTDYVFDGDGRALLRGRSAQPARRLRPLEALRRGGGPAPRPGRRGGAGGGGLRRPHPDPLHLRLAGGREALPRRAGARLPRPAGLDHARLGRRGPLPGAPARDRSPRHPPPLRRHRARPRRAGPPHRGAVRAWRGRSSRSRPPRRSSSPRGRSAAA